LREVFSLLERIIPTDARVMIEGESGTGKELIARILHYNGPNKNGPFVGVDCGAFPEKLLESELFGYVKGAFTGATKDKPGLYEEAQNGTLFLDEITNMPVNIQSKLLRALQEGEIRPVGSTKVKKMHVRVLSAASDSLAQKMQEGKFRQDLYYRLNVVNVKLPPLRERYEDIPILANHFLEKYSKKYHKKVAGLNSETLNILESYPWPGNIRELENIMERIIILIDPGKTNISTKLLPIEILAYSPKSSVIKNSNIKSNSLSIKDRQLNYEKMMLIESLTKNNWNQSLAAKELDIHESTIRYKMRKFGIKKK
jgi:two-component system response regulator PilR (NtrC family)